MDIVGSLVAEALYAGISNVLFPKYFCLLSLLLLSVKLANDAGCCMSEHMEGNNSHLRLMEVV